MAESILFRNVSDALKEVSTANPLPVTGSFSTSVPSTLTGGSKTVTTSGTAVALAATTAVTSVYVRAKSTNTGNIYVGDSTVDVSTSQQIVLAPNDFVTISIDDLATIFIDSDVNGEGVDFLAVS